MMYTITEVTWVEQDEFLYFNECRQDYLDMVLTKFIGVHNRERRRFLMRKLDQWYDHSLLLYQNKMSTR